MSDKGENGNGKVDAGEQIKAMLAEMQKCASTVRDMASRIYGLSESVEARVGDIQRGRPLTRRERILASLAGETRSQSYLADDTAIGYGTLGAELVLMEADGLVAKVGRGTWKAVSA